MPKPKSRSAQRSFTTVAATALVIGGSFIPAAAASNVADPLPEMPSASTTVNPSARPAETSGLSEAVQRDLGKTLEEFNAEAEASEDAVRVREKLSSEAISSSASATDGQAGLKVSKADVAKTHRVAESTAQSDAGITAKIGELIDANDVYQEVLENVDPAEFSRLTAIMNTEQGLQVFAGGPAESERSTSHTQGEASGSGTMTLEEFVEMAPGVEFIESAGPAMSAADNDYFGAMAYFFQAPGFPAPIVDFCSTGFNAWSPDGEDAILTAGHCTHDGESMIFGILEQTEPGFPGPPGAPLGNFGFSQFGGTNNAGIPVGEFIGLTDEDLLKVLEDTQSATDIAVIDNINPDLNLPAAVSNWTEAGPRLGTVKVTGVSGAEVGDAVCSSGRTTGWGCSKIFGVGIFFAMGYNEDVRPVWGYAADNPGLTVMNRGDSGGPVLKGSHAVGINSAYMKGATDAEDVAFYTSLAHVQSEGYIEGYQIKLFVNAPSVESPASGSEAKPGSEIRGTVADSSDGTKVNIIVDGLAVDAVPVDPSGAFSFKAPMTEGEHSFTLQAVNGFNKSEQVTGSVLVVAPSPSLSLAPTESTPSSAASDSDEKPSESASSSVATGGATSTSDAPSRSTENDVPTSSEPLAETGARSVPLIAAGCALALIGVAVLLTRRGTRRHG